jgi:hypothetical protein
VLVEINDAKRTGQMSSYCLDPSFTSTNRTYIADNTATNPGLRDMARPYGFDGKTNPNGC